MKIKFRVWDTREKRWVDGFALMDGDGDLHDADEFEMADDRYIVSLWTGLTDSAGKEIYEGDLTYVGVVRHGEYEPCLDFHNGLYWGWYTQVGGSCQPMYGDLQYTVVGNVYESAKEAAHDAAE